MDSQVARLSAAARALVAIETPQDAIAVVRLAEAARVYARQAKLGAEAENAATAIRLKAEIRLAETVTAGQKAGEIAQLGANQHVRDADTQPATLSDLGIDRQRLAEARIIAEHFTLPAIDGLAEDASEHGRTLSRSSVLREAQSEDDAQFGRMAGQMIDPDTLRRNRIGRLEGALHAAHLAFDAIEGGPLTSEEARPALITLTALQRKLNGGRKDRLEVVS